MPTPRDFFELPDLDFGELTEKPTVVLNAIGGSRQQPSASKQPPRRKAKKPPVPAEPSKPVEPPKPEKLGKLLRPSEFTGGKGREIPKFYATDIDWDDLGAAANKYLSHVSTEVPPGLELMRKWRRYIQLKALYSEDKESMLPSERQELKDLHSAYKAGRFKAIFDEL